jgi:predicted ATPase with chaperone activity
MLARRLTAVLPVMTAADALETTRIHRIDGLTGARAAVGTARPFRALPHTISAMGLLGGGPQLPAVGCLGNSSQARSGANHCAPDPRTPAR